jgi:hypothetical protein
MSRSETFRNLLTLRWRGAAARRRERRLAFFVAGVQKGGTTTLDRLLRLHPDIELPHSRKELHYFDADERFDGNQPRDGYALLQDEFHFDRPIAGEVTPSYVYWEAALPRIRAYNPAARIVVLFRSPVLRACSHWGHLDRKTRENGRPGAPLDPFAERLEREARALRKNSRYQDLGLSHIGRSLYAPQIARLREFFPDDQLLFLKSERFFAGQHVVADEVCRFLGVVPLTAVAAPPAFHANAGSASPIAPADWDAAYPHFAEDIDAVERLLGWDCADWRRPPRLGPDEHD